MTAQETTWDRKISRWRKKVGLKRLLRLRERVIYGWLDVKLCVVSIKAYYTAIKYPRATRTA